MPCRQSTDVHGTVPPSAPAVLAFRCPTLAACTSCPRSPACWRRTGTKRPGARYWGSQVRRSEGWLAGCRVSSVECTGRRNQGNAWLGQGQCQHQVVQERGSAVVTTWLAGVQGRFLLLSHLLCRHLKLQRGGSGTWVISATVLPVVGRPWVISTTTPAQLWFVRTVRLHH